MTNDEWTPIRFGLDEVGFTWTGLDWTGHLRLTIYDLRAPVSLPTPKFEQSHDGAGNVIVTFQNDHKHRRKFIDSNAVNTVVSADIFKILTDDEKRLINHVVKVIKRRLGDRKETT